MSTKKRYNLSFTVATMNELVQGPTQHVDISVYAIQIAKSHTMFTDINHTAHGPSKTGNFSDSDTGFILFGFDGPGNTDALRLVVYNAASNLLGTTNGNKSMCINIPAIAYPFALPPSANTYMVLVEGMVAGLRDAMKDCTSVVKTGSHTLYFAVPESMKEALTIALERIE